MVLSLPRRGKLFYRGNGSMVCFCWFLSGEQKRGHRGVDAWGICRSPAAVRGTGDGRGDVGRMRDSLCAPYVHYTHGAIVRLSRSSRFVELALEGKRMCRHCQLQRQLRSTAPKGTGGDSMVFIAGLRSAFATRSRARSERTKPRRS